MVVQRQYTGTAGRIENAQVAVYLAYAAPAGHTLIDRRLYLPKAWCEDRERRAPAGVPDDIEFATKPDLAAQMITAALDAGMPARRVAGDEVYGTDPGLATRTLCSRCALSPVFTNSELPTTEADITHRKHAIVETTFADLIAGPPAHIPSGLFAANCAWFDLRGDRA